MQIFVNVAQKILKFDVNIHDTISSVKNKITEKERIPSERIRLISLRQILQNEKKLSDYKISNSNALTASVDPLPEPFRSKIESKNRDFVFGGYIRQSDL